MATLSILGLYNYDPTVFDNLVIPTAADITNDTPKVSNPWVPDKDVLIHLICMRYAELSLVYPDLDDMRLMIGFWSAARLPVWVALYNTLLYKYNPIWNKDADFLETRNLAGSDNRTANLTYGETRDLTREEVIDDLTTELDGSVTHQVVGFDSSSFSDESKNIPDTTETVNGTTTTTDSGTVDRTETGTDNHATTDTGTIRRIENGNIGVTTTQQMIEAQRNIVAFNLYETIAEEFKKEFCVMIY